MITTPFTRVYPNTQDGVVDCGELILTIGYSNEMLMFSTDGGLPNQILTISNDNVALHVNVDQEGTIPMVVQEQGYEWTPVYTRKLT